MPATVLRPYVNRRRGPKTAPSRAAELLAFDRHGDVVDVECRTDGELLALLHVRPVVLEEPSARR